MTFCVLGMTDAPSKAKPIGVYRALLVGLGRVAWRGFQQNPSAETHYQAMSQHQNIKVVGAVDTDDAARLSFQQDTALHVYPDLQTALQDATPDIVVVATPPSTHCQLVCLAAGSASVKGILCEKPMATSVEDCAAMITACKDKVLLIGHQRRYEKNHLLLRAFLKSEVIGRPVGGRCVFPGEDWLNNGTHAADTMRFLVGDEIPFSLRRGKLNYRQFQAHIACRYGIVELESYNHLVGGYRKAMMDDLIESIESGNRPECSGEDGMEAVRLALAAEEMWNGQAA